MKRDPSLSRASSLARVIHSGFGVTSEPDSAALRRGTLTIFNDD